MKKLFLLIQLFFIIFYSKNVCAYEIISRGSKELNHIYLTFDDGYTVKNLTKILDTLKLNNVNASFFIEGDFMKYNHDLVKRIADEQTLCNHTMCHKDIRTLTNQEFILDIKQFEELAYQITGKEIKKYFRPPMGFIDNKKARILEERGYKIFKWDVAIYDYNRHKDLGVNYVKKNIINNVSNGSIILMHTLTNSNASALNDIIIELKKRGFEFASLDSLV